jgi:hypothetical protein
MCVNVCEVIAGKMNAEEAMNGNGMAERKGKGRE